MFCDILSTDSHAKTLFFREVKESISSLRTSSEVLVQSHLLILKIKSSDLCEKS